ncbi:MFS general substrate transporter [Fomes fomentarius]|nr:MFS general substrate transporter [Fomes fomentarius]
MSLKNGEEAVVLRTFPTHNTSDAIARTSRNGQESEPTHNIEPSRNYQYLLVLAGFMMTFHVIGINSIYGLFQEFYTSPETNIKNAEGQDALVSLVGTIGSGLTWSGSIFVNPLIGRYDNVKFISIAGAFIMSTGIILASFSSQLWHLFLTQGLLYGIGSSMYYFPLMSLTPAAAMGIVLAGSGVGGLVLSPVFHTLLSRLGIRWAMRILGIWNLVMGIPISSVLTKRHGAAAGATGHTRSFGAFLQAAGNTVPVYFLTTYSISILSYSSSTGSLLLAVNTAVNSVARIAMGVLADRVGRQNTMILSVILSAVSVFAFWYESDRGRFIAFIILYGVWAGGYNALLPTTIAEVYGVQNYSSVNGFIYFIRGLGALFGAPIAGVILGSHQRGAGASTRDQMFATEVLRSRYNDIALYGGVLLMASGVCVAYVRWLDARNKGGWTWRA